MKEAMDKAKAKSQQTRERIYVKVLETKKLKLDKDVQDASR
jgi:hypothetical protein